MEFVALHEDLPANVGHFKGLVGNAPLQGERGHVETGPLRSQIHLRQAPPDPAVVLFEYEAVPAGSRHNSDASRGRVRGHPHEDVAVEHGDVAQDQAGFLVSRPGLEIESGGRLPGIRKDALPVRLILPGMALDRQHGVPQLKSGD